jgi:copper chaperone CopZ
VNSKGNATAGAEPEAVAPGLVMERARTAEEDGRTLIYYDFRRAGGGPGQVTLDVPDLACEACATAIRQALAGVAGVTGVEIDVPGKRVSATFDTRRTSATEIQAAIEGAGFTVSC